MSELTANALSFASSDPKIISGSLSSEARLHDVAGLLCLGIHNEVTFFGNHSDQLSDLHGT